MLNQRSILLGFVCLSVGLIWGEAAYYYKLPPHATFKALKIRFWDPWTRASIPLEYRHFAERRAPDAAASQDLSQLEGLSYLGAVNPSQFSGVTVYKAEAAYDKPRLLTLGHRAEAQLISPAGDVLHRWSREFRSAFPDRADESDEFGAQSWRAVLLRPDGGLLALYENHGLVWLDIHSNVVATNGMKAHHAIIETGRGTFYGLAREREVLDWFDPSREVANDYIVELDRSGAELRRVSILEALRRSSFAPVLRQARESLKPDDPLMDVLHTNSLQLLDGAHAADIPGFKAGNVLISMRKISMIASLNVDEGRVEWGASGMFSLQHDPVLLPTGTILLFDNFGYPEPGKPMQSRVIEFDPRNMDVVWQYDDPEGDMLTLCCGMAQRLPNQNTLITETDNGRAFEVTPDGEIVWEYYAPERKQEYIARLFEARALDETPSWLKSLDSPDHVE